jgi:hypothetical protein
LNNYLEIPFLIEFSTVPEKTSSGPRFFINSGITTCFLTRSKIWTQATAEYGKALDYDKKKEDWNDVNHTDFGFIVGIGCYFKEGLSLGLEYEKGIKSVSSVGWDLKNVVFSVKIGYYFKW